MFRKNIFKSYSKIKIIQRTKNGISYLVENDLPFHTYFNQKSNPKYKINENWEFCLKGETEVEIVQLPHCFNTPQSAHRFYNGKVVYKKMLDFSDVKADMDNSVHLVFNGSFYTTKVWLDDVYLGKNIGGYNQFRFDITKFTKSKQKAKLKVEVDNTLNRASIPPELYKGHALGWHPFGGIHKDVYLEVCPSIYAFKCHAVTSDVQNNPKVTLKMLFHNPSKISLDDFYARVQIMIGQDVIIEAQASVSADSENGDICTSIIGFDIIDAKLWNAESPRLYKAKIPFYHSRNFNTCIFNKLVVS